MVKLQKQSRAVNVLNQLIQLSVNGEVITDQNVNYTLALSMEDKQEKVTELYDELICPYHWRTADQAEDAWTEELYSQYP